MRLVLSASVVLFVAVSYHSILFSALKKMSLGVEIATVLRFSFACVYKLEKMPGFMQSFRTVFAV